MGFPPTRIEPGHIQAPAGEGTQGWGVSTPIAAAVAEATVGFAMEVHIPQGITLVIGAASAMLATGFPPTRIAI